MLLEMLKYKSWEPIKLYTQESKLKINLNTLAWIKSKGSNKRVRLFKILGFL
jgi:hypothetical protein